MSMLALNPLSDDIQNDIVAPKSEPIAAPILCSSVNTPAPEAATDSETAADDDPIRSDRRTPAKNAMKLFEPSIPMKFPILRPIPFLRLSERSLTPNISRAEAPARRRSVKTVPLILRKLSEGRDGWNNHRSELNLF